MRTEAAYQRNLIMKLEALLPNCFIIKNDPSITQGMPDLLILWEDRWAMLELKVSENEPLQPNQAHYVDKFNKLSFAAFIWPEIEEQVLYDLQTAFGIYH